MTDSLPSVVFHPVPPCLSELSADVWARFEAAGLRPALERFQCHDLDDALDPAGLRLVADRGPFT